MSLAERYGPWALVAGASEGTGSAFARQLAAAGINCILVARRTAPLEALADDLRRDHDVECVVAAIDLAQTDAAEILVAAAGGREIGLFVYNAGSDPNSARFLDADLSAWTDLVQRNTLTMMKAAYLLARPMVRRRRGGLLLVNSGACYGGASTLGPYAGSKAFTLCLAEALWAELKPQGVDVLTLVLGRTDTPEFRRLLGEKGMALPADAADPADVARMGLDRLPHGPVHNMGQADAQAGVSAQSAADRRARILAIDASTARLFGRT